MQIDSRNIRNILRDGVECKVNSFGTTLLMEAAADGDTALIKELLALKADPNARDQGENTALHYGAANGKVTAIRLLVDGGADVLAKNTSGETPLACGWSVYGHTHREGDKETCNDLMDTMTVLRKYEKAATEKQATRPVEQARPADFVRANYR